MGTAMHGVRVPCVTGCCHVLSYATVTFAKRYALPRRVSLLSHSTSSPKPPANISIAICCTCVRVFSITSKELMPRRCAPWLQLKLPEAARDYLGDAEEAFKAAREARKGELWDGKMRATQTESAFGVRAL